MEALKEYNIPLTGLKPGDHVYKYVVDDQFFKQFEHSPIEQGRFEIDITLDRKIDMAVLSFDIRGSYFCSCDRCLTDINLPVRHKAQLILRFEEGEDTDELIFLDPKAAEWNTAKVLFELISLAKPLTNIYDCKGEQCDEVVLKKLKEFENIPPVDESIWKDLKDIKLN